MRLPKIRLPKIQKGDPGFLDRPFLIAAQVGAQELGLLKLLNDVDAPFGVVPNKPSLSGFLVLDLVLELLGVDFGVLTVGEYQLDGSFSVDPFDVLYA